MSEASTRASRRARSCFKRSASGSPSGIPVEAGERSALGFGPGAFGSDASSFGSDANGFGSAAGPVEYGRAGALGAGALSSRTGGAPGAGAGLDTPDSYPRVNSG